MLKKISLLKKRTMTGRARGGLVSVVTRKAPARPKVTPPRTKTMVTRGEASPRKAGEDLETAMLKLLMTVQMMRMEKIVKDPKGADVDVDQVKDVVVTTMMIRVEGTSLRAAGGTGAMKRLRILTEESVATGVIASKN